MPFGSYPKDKNKDKEPTHAIFLKSRGFKYIKYDNMKGPDQTRPDCPIHSRRPFQNLRYCFDRRASFRINVLNAITGQN